MDQAGRGGQSTRARGKSKFFALYWFVLLSSLKPRDYLNMISIVTLDCSGGQIRQTDGQLGGGDLSPRTALSWLVLSSVVPVLQSVAAGVTRVGGKIFVIGGFRHTEEMLDRASSQSGNVFHHFYRPEVMSCRLLRPEHRAVEHRLPVPPPGLGARLSLPQRPGLQVLNTENCR